MKYAQIISPLLRLQDLFGLLSNERKEDEGGKKDRQQKEPACKWAEELPLGERL